jgi:hypothetical protein
VQEKGDKAELKIDVKVSKPESANIGLRIGAEKQAGTWKVCTYSVDMDSSGDSGGSDSDDVPTAPSSMPSGYPTGIPSGYPTGLPSGYPTGLPSGYPTDLPSGYPTGLPSGYPSDLPSISGMPSIDLPPPNYP